MKKHTEIINAVQVGPDETYTLTQVCEICDIRDEFIYSLVDYGAVEPAETSRKDWSFNARSLRLLRIAARLHRDLDIDIPGLCLALDLLEENDRLRRTTKRLREKLSLFDPGERTD